MTSMAARWTNRSTSRSPCSPYRLSMTIPASTRAAAEMRWTGSASRAAVTRGASGSFIRLAMIDDVSMTIGRLVRESVFVVTDDLFVSPAIEDWQAGYSILNALDVVAKRRRAAATGCAD